MARRILSRAATHFGACCAVLAALLGVVPSSPAADGPLDGWRRLQLEGRRFWVASGKAVIERWPAGEGRDIAVHRIETGYRALGKSRTEWAYAFVDRSDVGVYRTQRWLEWSPGRKARLGRLDADGRVEIIRYDVPALKKRREKPKLDPSLWTVRSKKTYTLPSTEEVLDALDTWSLLAMLGEMSSKDVLLLGNSEVLVLNLRRDLTREMTLHLTDYDTGKRSHRRLQVVALDVQKDGDGGAFLGMQGRIRIWIEKYTGALVEISGKVKGLPGTTRLTLTGFSRKPGKRPELRVPPAETNDPG